MVGSACQPGYDVGIFNLCPTPVEVDVSDVKPDTDGAVASWVTVDPGVQRGAALVADVEYIYVRVRTEGDTDVHTFKLALDSVPIAPATVEYDVEVTLEGSRCPD